MADDELAQLRARRMAEMQAQQQQQGGAEQQQQRKQEQQSQEESKNMMLASILDMSARTRLNGIKVVKPEKAAMIENMLISMARGGQIRGKVNEEQLKGLLGQVSEKMQKKTSIRFARREMDDDDEDDMPETDSDDDE